MGQVDTVGIAGLSESAELYRKQGFVVLRNAVSPATVEAVLATYMQWVHSVTGLEFSGPQDPELIRFYQDRPDLEARIYDAMAAEPELVSFSTQGGLLNRLAPFFTQGFNLLRKIIFRMDEPMRTNELAHWHQDYFYVKGNPDVITAWIPLQEIRFQNGCLSVMPGSHTLGLLPHDLIIGKRHIPSTVFDREIRMVEMKQGDVLLFHSQLVHSSNLNLSGTIRYTVQARYSPKDAPWDPGMRGLVELPV